MYEVAQFVIYRFSTKLGKNAFQQLEYRGLNYVQISRQNFKVCHIWLCARAVVMETS